jgi:hypothetical protein
MSPVFHRMPSACQHPHQRSWPTSVRAGPKWACRSIITAAALHAALGHALDAQRLARARCSSIAAGRRHAGIGAVQRAEDVDLRAVAVVVARLGHAVAVGVEQLAHVREAVPLRGVLQVHQHQVVADHVAVRGLSPTSR